MKEKPIEAHIHSALVYSNAVKISSVGFFLNYIFNHRGKVLADHVIARASHLTVTL